MSEAKKIGASKYKNKQKYKHKAKVVQKSKECDDSVDDGDKIVIDDDYPYRRRGLESNWHRYEAKDEAEEVIDVARDFSVIVSAPISQGNYFQFKSDKNLDNHEEEQFESEIFKLDMKLLGLSLSSIPFHIRCNIDEKYFSEEDLIVSNANAKKAIEQYERALKEREEQNEHRTESEDIQEDTTSENNDKPSQDNCTSQALKRDSTESQNLDDKLIHTEKEDLEKWLDDILDD